MQPTTEPTHGAIELYSHANGRIGVMLEITAQTEPAAQSDAFRRFAHEVALQVTSLAPLYVSDADIPAEVLADLVRESAERARTVGKPEAIIEKITAGVVEKYKNTHVLLRQAYIRDETVTIAQLLDQLIVDVGEPVVIRRFLRWEIVPEEE